MSDDQPTTVQMMGGHLPDGQTPEIKAKLKEAMLIGIAALCIGINVGLGVVVYLTKLPIYLDAVGTIACAILLGSWGRRGCAYAAFVGAASFVITGVLLNPVVIWFIPTQIAIAIYTFYVARRTLDRFAGSEVSSVRRVGVTILTGLGLGVVAGTVSAPIIAYVFGGITGAGASVIAAALLKAGQTLYQSVLASGLASEPIDKTIQLIAALALVRATPSRIRALLG